MSEQDGSHGISQPSTETQRKKKGKVRMPKRHSHYRETDEDKWTLTPFFYWSFFFSEAIRRERKKARRAHGIALYRTATPALASANQYRLSQKFVRCLTASSTTSSSKSLRWIQMSKPTE